MDTFADSLPCEHESVYKDPQGISGLFGPCRSLEGLLGLEGPCKALWGLVGLCRAFQGLLGLLSRIYPAAALRNGSSLEAYKVFQGPYMVFEMPHRVLQGLMSPYKVFFFFFVGLMVLCQLAE